MTDINHVRHREAKMLNDIKSFGLNIIPEKEAVGLVGSSVENALSGLWEPILDYLEENDNVFSGQVLNEIARLDNQAMRLGMTLSAGEEKPQLNVES